MREPGRIGIGFLRTAQGWPYLLAPLIPVAVALEIAGVPATVVFAASALGIIPTAALMGRATEELAARSGPGIGGLLNVTFGNAPELIIALFALGQGLHEVVKASIIGSIIGNILLVLGAAMLVGGLGRDRQRFNATAANVQSLMLFLAAAALVMPAIFELVEGQGLPSPGAELVDYGSEVEQLSVAVAVVLILTYVAGLVFSLRTHRALFNPPYEDEGDTFGWSVRRSVIMLAIALLVVPGLASAQDGVIAGTVYSEGQLRPIAGAQISVADQAGKGAVSDASGRFRITGVSGSQVSLNARMIGYRAATQTVRVGATDIRFVLGERPGRQNVVYADRPAVENGDVRALHFARERGGDEVGEIAWPHADGSVPAVERFRQRDHRRLRCLPRLERLARHDMPYQRGKPVIVVGRFPHDLTHGRHVAVIDCSPEGVH